MQQATDEQNIKISNKCNNKTTSAVEMETKKGLRNVVKQNISTLIHECSAIES